MAPPPHTHTSRVTPGVLHSWRQLAQGLHCSPVLPLFDHADSGRCLSHSLFTCSSNEQKDFLPGGADSRRISLAQIQAVPGISWSSPAPDGLFQRKAAPPSLLLRESEAVPAFSVSYSVPNDTTLSRSVPTEGTPTAFWKGVQGL